MSLEPPPADELTIIDPSCSATRVRPPGRSGSPRRTPRTAAGRRGAAQVAVADLGRRGREVHELLGDPAVGVVLDHPRLLLELRRGGLRADEHALAAGLRGRLDDDLCQPAEHMRSLSVVGQQVGRHVLEDRLLAEVEADHLRHVVVDRLVVGDAGADRVGDRDRARPVGADQPGTPEQRVGPELERVDERVVETPVDRVHALQPGGRAHVTDGVADDEVGRLDQLDAHLPRQERVLEVGRVHRARRPQHDRRIALGGRRDRAQRVEQQRRVVLDGAHPVAGEQLRHQARHRDAGSRARRRSPRACGRCPRAPASGRRRRARGHIRRRGSRRRRARGRRGPAARSSWRLTISDHGTIPARTISCAW